MLAEHAATGRLTTAELEERVDAAYAARTRGQLDELTADLPVEHKADQASPAAPVEPFLMCFFVCLCPPAGLVYWLVQRRTARRRDRGVPPILRRGPEPA